MRIRVFVGCLFLALLVPGIGEYRLIDRGANLVWVAHAEEPVIVPGEAEAALETLTNDFLSLFFTTMRGDPLSEAQLAQANAMIAKGFIWDGQNKDDVLAFMADPQDDDPSEFVSFSGSPVFRKIDDTTYLVGVHGTITERCADTQETSSLQIDSFKDGFAFDATFTTYRRPTLHVLPTFPMIARKFEDGTWRFLGNGIKAVDVGIALNFVRQAGPPVLDTTSFSFEVGGAERFPIAGVTVTGPKITGTMNLTDVGDGVWQYVPQGGGWPMSGEGAVTHANGDTYTFVVTYEGGSRQTFIFQVAGLTPGYQPLAATVTTEATGVTVTWPQTAFPGDFDGYEVIVTGTGEGGDNIMFREENADPTITAFSFLYADPPTVFAPGSQLNVTVNSPRTNGLIQSFQKQITVPGA